MGVVDKLKSQLWGLYNRISPKDTACWWQLVESGEVYKLTKRLPSARRFPYKLWLPDKFWADLISFAKLSKQIVDYELLYIYGDSDNAKVLLVPANDVSQKIARDFTNVGIVALYSSQSSNFFVELKVFKSFLQSRALFLLVNNRCEWFLIIKARDLKPMSIKKSTVITPTFLATQGFVVYMTKCAYAPLFKINVENNAN